MTDPVVVVGGGITGLAAAHELSQSGVEFVLLEDTPRVGGKIDGGPVGSLEIDSAADGFLARQPEMAELCIEIGLGDDLVRPSGRRAFIWANGALRTIPAPSVLGVPLNADAVAKSGIVSDAGMVALRRGLQSNHPPLLDDASVGEVFRPIVGDEAFERLVDPLLGGINAGSADEMSIAASAPKLAEAAKLGGDVRANLASQFGESAKTPGPVFLGVKGGTTRIIKRLSERLDAQIHTGCPAESIEPLGGGWRVKTTDGALVGSKLILATPAPAAARLVSPWSPAAASILDDISYSSAVLVTFVTDRSNIAHSLDGSGFLVPRDQGMLMTACSWSSSKWNHYDDGSHAVVRVSAGRSDDRRWLDLDQSELVTTLSEELAATIGFDGEAEIRVTPWKDALPQYAPSHLARADEIDSLLGVDAPGVTVTGAAMRGLGLPACVRQGRAAARG